MYGLNRYVCDVLEEMRVQLKLRILNKDVMLSLIEEAQVMVNRMEAALGDQKDLEGLHKDIKERKQELRDLSDE